MRCKYTPVVNSEYKNHATAGAEQGVRNKEMPTLLQTVPDDVLHVITGNILGDGHIRPGRLMQNGEVSGNARYNITMIASSREYMVFICSTTYAAYRPSVLRAWPNTQLPHHVGKEVAHYNFSTGCCPIFTELHALWYRWDPNLKKFIKIVPYCIAKMFSARSLAH